MPWPPSRLDGTDGRPHGFDPSRAPPQATSYVLIHESILTSWAKDIVSLGTMAGLIYVNHQYGAGAWWIDALGVLSLLGYGIRHSRNMMNRHPVLTRQQLREWALSDQG